jgi:hypothetical protein
MLTCSSLWNQVRNPRHYKTIMNSLRSRRSKTMMRRSKESHRSTAKSCFQNPNLKRRRRNTLERKCLLWTGFKRRRNLERKRLLWSGIKRSRRWLSWRSLRRRTFRSSLKSPRIDFTTLLLFALSFSSLFISNYKEAN